MFSGHWWGGGDKHTHKNLLIFSYFTFTGRYHVTYFSEKRDMTTGLLELLMYNSENLIFLRVAIFTRAH